ncbi:hypothetical protein KR093_004422 [Drosophila rubida]|uniref:Uncharacterized protein n=1 Tax=Drosophila rubida TaxID=30044 RepID=A0AAD4K4C2_9MUSC|nr:hypothetical protein KR093_004422 [Drosophila rubida]
MVDRYYGSYEALSIQSCESLSEKTISTESNVGVIHVTADMVHNLHCPKADKESSNHSIVLSLVNAPTPPVSEAGDVDLISHETINFDQTEDLLPNCKHQVMIIFEQGDINSALHFLNKSMDNPFECNTVATVLVEESIRNEFVDRVVEGMRPMALEAAAMLKFRSTLDMLETLNVETIRCNCEYPEISPVLVFDCQHGQLAVGTTGVICVRTFTEIAEIVDICVKESLLFSTSSLWNESIEDLYQLVVSLNCPTFYFNCCDVSLEPIVKALEVVAHLSQTPPERSVMLAPISYLNE